MFKNKNISALKQFLIRSAYFSILLAVILSSVSFVFVPTAVFAAASVSATNGSINANFPGALVPASSPVIAIAKISVTASAVSKTLTSAQVNFSGTGFATSDLFTLATDQTSGVALYQDHISLGTVGSFDSNDTFVPSASLPVFSGGNIVLTPAAPAALSNGVAVIFFVVIKTSSTISNGDIIAATIPANGVITSDGNGPTADFVINNLRADTTPTTITSIMGSTSSNTLTVMFSKPVQKVGGGNLAVGDFAYVDGGGSTHIISAVTHTAGQNYTTLNMQVSGVNANLDALDLTSGTVAAGSNKIADMSGNVIGISPVNISNPLTITTAVIPNATVGTTYSSDSPLETLVASGGTIGVGYKWRTNSTADTAVLTAIGITSLIDSADNTTGKVFGTGAIANTPGSFRVTMKVTDNANPPVTSTKEFTINVAPSGGSVPGINGVGPAGAAQSSTAVSVGIGGVNTHFSSSSVVQFIASGANDTNITSTISSSSTTGLALSVNVGASATLGAHDIKVTTGTEVAFMPNAFSVFAAGASGLNLLLPTDAATNVQMPPGFNFSPSTNSSNASYRLMVKSTSDFSGAALWDYVFPKPVDGQNPASHCSSSMCSLGFGAGTFRVITQPSQLAPNTTYYWQIRTYSGAVSAVSDSATPLESTVVRGFTTVSSLTDVVTPQIMHRPVMQMSTGGDRTIFARVTDNIATSTSTPALSSILKYCNSSASCDAAAGSSITGTLVGAGYYKYVIPQAVVDHANSASFGIRYYLTASDGSNTTNFKQPNGTDPFAISIAALTTTHKLAGVVMDSASACLAGVTVFADGTAFNNVSSTTTCAGGTYSLSSIPPGSYDLVAFKDGYGEKRMQGVFAILAADSSPAYNFSFTSGSSGGFGGDTTAPRVKFTGPMDNMKNLPGGTSDFRVFVVFDKDMSQSTITSTNLTVNDVNPQSGALTDITTSKGSWTYYSTAPTSVSFAPPEAKMAFWALSGSNTLGDNKTIAVKLNNVTDTAGNSLQGNQPDGSYAFTFSTGTSASFSGFNATTGAFSGGGTFGSGQFVPPAVSGSTPAPGAINVSLNSKIILNFSEAMADDSGSYILKDFVKLFSVFGTTETDITSTAINTVSLDTTKRNATVALKSAFNSGLFASSTIYRVKVLGGAKSATSITLGPPAEASTVKYTAQFKTGTTSDSAAPSILGLFPDNAATAVPVNVGAVSVSFSKDMSVSTLTTSTFYLSVGSTAVNGTVEYDAVSRTAMFLPKSALTQSTTYTVNFTASIQALNGQALTASTRTFTTGSADTASPSVAFVNADDYNLAITFSEPMNTAKVTDTLNFAASILKQGNYALEYGTAGFIGGAGTSITIPTSASLSYDASKNTLSISGYHDSSVTAATLLSKEILITVTNVKDLSGNAITTTSNANKGRAPIQNSSTTKGALGPGAVSGDAFSQQGSAVPANFSSTTFGFAPSVEVKPFNMMAGQTTIYGIRLPIGTKIPVGGQIILTFPTGFDVSGAKQDINSPMRTDLNGPGTGTPTFKCTTATGGTSCGGSATVTGDATGDTTTKGGLADDGVIVNTSLRTVTIYLSAETNTAGNDFLNIDIAGIKNSTVPKDFNTSGYTVDVKTKSADGSTLLESLTSKGFFIQSVSGTAYTLSGTITATSASSGTMKVYLMSPMTGMQEVTSSTFSSGSATYSFTNLQAGDYMLMTDPSITLGATEYAGKNMPERVVISEAADIASSGANDDIIPYNFSISNASSGGTNMTININGPSAELLDIFAGSPSGFKSKQVTLDSVAGAEAFTINLANGTWFVGVGPQMPKGFGGAPKTPNYLPPKPKEVKINSAICTVDGTTGCSTTFTLTTSTKTIKGLVKDGSSKVIASAEVYAYSPNGGSGTHTQTDTTGAFTLNVVDGTYIVGSFIPGMPPSKEVPVTVSSHATTYLLIDGATTAITPAAAASSFILKLAKPDYTISGKVTDGTNVVQGASVYAYRSDGPGHVNAMTDSSGNYTLYVANGNWKVGTFLPQYGNLAEITVTISSASASNQNFSPSLTGTFYSVSGTVTSGGSAVQGAFVRISGNSTFNETITAADGTYSFKVPEGNGYVVRAFLPSVGESAPVDSFNVSGADVTGKNITVSTPRTITITLSSSVTEAFVELKSSTGVGNRARIANVTSGTLSVPDGSYTVRVDIPGTSIGLTSIAATNVDTIYSSITGILTVNSNEGLTVTVPTRRTITGTVLDSGATAVADVWVDISSPSTGVHLGTKTGTDGTFSLSVADGTYQINAMKPGYFREQSSLIVSSSTTAQTLTVVAATTTIAGQIKVGSTGIANAFVRAEKTTGGFAGTQADANGNYTLPVTSGLWRVYGVADGYAEVAYASNPIDVSSGSVTGKDITLTTTVTLSAVKTKPVTPASGGTLEDTTSGVKITIPANALGSDTSSGEMTAKETNNVRGTATATPLNGYDSTGGTYQAVGKEIKATDSDSNPITNLNSDITVEMTYTLAELTNTSSSSDSSINTKAEADMIKMSYWDETTQSWVTDSTTITYKDSSGNVITDATTIDTVAEFALTVATITIASSTDHLSLYAPVVSSDSSAPATPTNFVMLSASTSQVTLSWTAVSGATSYDIYRSATSNGTFERVGSEPTVSSGSTTTYSDTGLSLATTYYYKITALNSSNESASSSAVPGTTNGGGGGGSGTSYSSPVVTTPLATPAALTATTASATQINLSWASVSSATGYKLSYGLSSSGPFTPIAISSASTVKYQHTGLTANTTYYYKIISTTLTEDSSASTVVSAKTNIAVVTPVVTAPVEVKPTTPVVIAPITTTPLATVAPTVVKSKRDLEKEKTALKDFTKKYNKLPKSSADWKWVNDKAYPATPVKSTPSVIPVTPATPVSSSRRDLTKERKAIADFAKENGRLPKSSADWKWVNDKAYPATPAPSKTKEVVDTSSGYSRDLKVGSKGSDVSTLQAYFGIKQTGTFDTITKKAVQEYQKAHDIVPANGNVGPLTRVILNSKNP